MVLGDGRRRLIGIREGDLRDRNGENGFLDLVDDLVALLARPEVEAAVGGAVAVRVP